MFSKPYYAPAVILGGVYVLELRNGFYYIGWSKNINFRYSQHVEGKGSVWTKRHPPIRLVEFIIPATREMEDRITEKYMSIYGAGKVRGGKYCFKNYCECCNVELKNNYTYCKYCAYKKGLIPYY